MQGIIYKSTGSWYILKDDEGNVWNARIKGKLKIDGTISSTNTIAVGDNVNFYIENEDTKTGINFFMYIRGFNPVFRKQYVGTIYKKALMCTRK